MASEQHAVLLLAAVVLHQTLQAYRTMHVPCVTHVRVRAAVQEAGPFRLLSGDAGSLNVSSATANTYIVFRADAAAPL